MNYLFGKPIIERDFDWKTGEWDVMKGPAYIQHISGQRYALPEDIKYFRLWPAQPKALKYSS